jgi:PTH1 family peptidyl-tRNA hydrolase
VKLIVGLGNPGFLYRNSRHNAGFRVVKALALKQKTVLRKDNLLACLSAKTIVNGQSLILAQPLTFMNLSGLAVKGLVKRFKIDPQDLLVVCDDLDLELGRIKIRPKGASAGQRGLQSIIVHLGTGDFPRLRLGIGRPPGSMDAAKYVLSGFSRAQKELAAVSERIAVDCCFSWIERGITETMNIFNTRSGNE